jgi:hypothetical protein
MPIDGLIFVEMFFEKPQLTLANDTTILRCPSG